MKTYIATKEEQTAQTAKLNEINVKVTPVNLESVVVGILDFNIDDITITSGGLDSLRRRITT